MIGAIRASAAGTTLSVASIMIGRWIAGRRDRSPEGRRGVGVQASAGATAGAATAAVGAAGWLTA